MSRITDEVAQLGVELGELTTVHGSALLLIDRLIALVEGSAGDEAALKEGLAAIKAKRETLADKVAAGTAAADEAEAEPTE